MVNSPDVSVIVPVFNGRDGLEFSLRSLLNQTLKKLEIIVVNDASTDTSKMIIDQLVSENGNIVAIHLPENRGVHEARLAGIKKAAAPWVGFLDADDFARPKMFEVMLEAGKKENVDIVVCGSYRMTSKHKPIAQKLRFKSSRKVVADVFGKFCRFEFGTGMLWNKLYRREIIVPYGDMHFPWRQDINEDLLLNIGCFYKAKSIYLSDKILHEYVFAPSSVTSTINNANAYVDTYKAYALAVNFFSELGDDAIEAIIEMYRVQLSFECYLIDDVKSILVHQEKLKEASDLIYCSYPAALALLSARKRPSRVGARLAISSLAYRSLIFFGFDPNLFKS